MNIIVPMAGMGKRLRPHTLTTPKPLVKVAGKPIVQHLVEDISDMIDEQIERIVFVTGRFGPEAEAHLLEVASALGAKGEIAYQDEALGTAHAVWCAKHALCGKTIVAFADTLFRADFKIDPATDGMLWVKKIENPESFGVVKLNGEGVITDYVEKPKTFVSDLAMIGIYYFREGEKLGEEIKYLIENEVMKSGEYQLPDALRRLTESGVELIPGKVDEWLDCGNPEVTILTNARVLELKYPNSYISETANIKDSVILNPCFIDENANIEASVIGPHVTVGKGTTLKNTRMINGIVQDESSVRNIVSGNFMIGSAASIEGEIKKYNLGDYNTIG